jgi:DNA-binding PadR family transcriptional regulator
MSWYDVSCDAVVADKRDPSAYLPLTSAVFHVLLSVADGQKHGYAILKEVEARTDGSVRLSTGTLYGIIKRMLQDGWIRESVLGSTDRRRAYRLTAFGRKIALAEANRLRDLVRVAESKALYSVPSEG